MQIDNLVLKEFYNIISENKIELFDKYAALRTRYITVVLENIFQEHNASAVMRSCDCFGIQDLHTIEKDNEYQIQRDIARGAGNWVDLFNYSKSPNPTLECINSLKAKNYTIVATTPHEKETSIKDLPLDKPIAMVFGTEMEGISNDVRENADYFIKLPMYGFTESYNVSVSVSLALQALRGRMEDENTPFLLSEEDQTKLKIQWSTKIIRDGENLEQEIRKRILEKLK